MSIGAKQYHEKRGVAYYLEFQAADDLPFDMMCLVMLLGIYLARFLDAHIRALAVPSQAPDIIVGRFRHCFLNCLELQTFQET